MVAMIRYISGMLRLEVGYLLASDAGTFQKLHTVGDAVKLVEHYPFYAGLYYKFGTLEAWG